MTFRPSAAIDNSETGSEMNASYKSWLDLMIGWKQSHGRRDANGGMNGALFIRHLSYFRL